VPRFYFDVHDGVDIIDVVGSDLAGLDEARDEAVRATSELLRGAQLAELWTGQPWRMVVLDAGRTELFTLRFSALVPKLAA
jgi:hypothetical protein